MDESDSIARLHATLPMRETPEQIAQLIKDVCPPSLNRELLGSIRHRLANSIQRRFGWSSMPTTFKAPENATKQLDKARELALLFLDERLPEGDDPIEVKHLVDQLNSLIGKASGPRSFRDDRLNREARLEHGLTLSRRRYDKLFRLAVRLEDKLARLEAEEAKHRLLLVSKAALAPELTLDQFDGHLPSAAFVAYYTSRMKLRSEFTIAGQQGPFDDLAAKLLGICEKDAGTSWFAIAHVFPRSDVLGRLTGEQKGALLGQWFNVLNETAEKLEIAYRRTDIDLDTMIVKRGNDSSTWNLFAAAWNRARDHWIALIEALELSALLDDIMPGKVMRLMAADVAAWHRSEGGGVHPDTKVWAELPKPWAVLRLEEQCNRYSIEQACAKHGVDPAKSGWTNARPRDTIASFRPTPELVHGVSVDNPYMATIFKRMGVFSGKPTSEYGSRNGEVD